MKRRIFLKTMAAATPAMMAACKSEKVAEKIMTVDTLGTPLPLRPLGATGENVSMLGCGGYHVGWTTEKDAQEVIEAALQGGIRFFDTAESYDNGGSETRYGKYLTPKYRDQVFIMTKTTGKDAATVQRHLDESLQRMKTDYLDLWQVHSLANPEDVDARIDNGVLDVFIKARESGKVRFIGFTGHSNPEAHLRMLERTRESNIFDTAQMPINVMDSNYHSFIKGVVPELQARNIALLAMKTLADGRFFPKKETLGGIQWESEDPVVPNRLSIADALNFVWSLPVSVLITGAENAQLMNEKIELAKSFTEMNEEKRMALIDKVADLADGKVEYYKNPVA
jgi:uncharacterized protein